MNLAVLCVMHHSVIHRAPSSAVVSSALERAELRVNGTTLVIVRDVALLMRALA
jgi:hypothetical protein